MNGRGQRMRPTILVIFLAALAGCATYEDKMAAWGAACQGYGFTPGTEAYAACVQREDLAYREQHRAIQGNLLRAAPQQPRICRTTSVGGVMTTTCN